jgi:hypothetical protein
MFEFLIAWAIACDVDYYIPNAVCNKWKETARNGAIIYKVQIASSTKIDIRTVGRCSYLGAKIARPYKKQVEDKWCLHEP